MHSGTIMPSAWDDAKPEGFEQNRFLRWPAALLLVIATVRADLHVLYSRVIDGPPSTSPISNRY
jgi:hypothetical protein